MDTADAASTLIWARQTYEGRMDYSAVTTSTVQDLLGREPIHLDSWAITHRQELLDQLSRQLRQGARRKAYGLPCSGSSEARIWSPP
ncbi:hypothetical protein [Streptomyces aureus]|uniref:Transposase n=1 Tax=Streptomyces aureus TaxID=193461 RepID=A0ABV4SJ82_9ACTN